MTLYSVRFLSSFATGTFNYQVPPGHRAVVRSISSSTVGADGGTVRVIVGGVTAWSRKVPASAGGVDADVRHVAYAGEYIGIYHSHEDLRTTVSGYLFDDAARASLQPDYRASETPVDARNSSTGSS